MGQAQRHKRDLKIIVSRAVPETGLFYNAWTAAMSRQASSSGKSRQTTGLPDRPILSIAGGVELAALRSTGRVDA